MLWLSADLSKSCSGLALWRGRELLRVTCLKTKGTKGKHVFGTVVYESDLAAWRWAFSTSFDGERPAALVLEQGLGHHMTTARILAEHRGGVLMLWRVLCGGPVTTVNVNEWRRVAREAWGVSWPKDGEACKVLARTLVREHFGREVTEDEADAVLVGHWALRTRAVEV